MLFLASLAHTATGTPTRTRTRTYTTQHSTAHRYVATGDGWWMVDDETGPLENSLGDDGCVYG